MVLPSSLGSSAKAVLVNEHEERQTAAMGRHREATEATFLRVAVTSISWRPKGSSLQGLAGRRRSRELIIHLFRDERIIGFLCALCF